MYARAVVLVNGNGNGSYIQPEIQSIRPTDQGRLQIVDAACVQFGSGGKILPSRRKMSREAEIPEIKLYCKTKLRPPPAGDRRPCY
jgi:hypothetical protein